MYKKITLILNAPVKESPKLIPFTYLLPIEKIIGRDDKIHKKINSKKALFQTPNENENADPKIGT
ncbi:hypothetical protein NBRC116494_17830 [Aurantivibrio plasticivorans]